MKAKSDQQSTEKLRNGLDMWLDRRKEKYERCKIETLSLCTPWRTGEMEVQFHSLLTFQLLTEHSQSGHLGEEVNKFLVPAGNRTRAPQVSNP